VWLGRQDLDMKQYKKINGIALMFVLLAALFAQGALVSSAGEIVGRSEATVCCEKTNSGLFCQDVPAEDCASDRQPPTACRSTSFCKPGFCYDSTEGTCIDGTPQMVCNDNGGIWNAEKPPQCERGCCILGDQAAFVTQVRCGRLSSVYGLETNYNPAITNEALCMLTARAEEKGACVYMEGFELTCKLTTRSECENGNFGETTDSGEEDNSNNENNNDNSATDNDNGDNSNENGNNDITGNVVDEATGIDTSTVGFHAGRLCSDDALKTNCYPSEQTVCLPGKEEVYWLDTCGNPANIYDASKASDKNYWAELKDKSESCNPTSSNENSPTCGNCNYLQGSYCRGASSETSNPRYGENICASLNCVDESGQERLHGESWCKYDGGLIGRVGSRHYRIMCVNGKIQTEPCADFRQEECIENTERGFSEAACRVNRWQDCTAQTEPLDCLNRDQRDCIWLPGIEFVLMGVATNGSSIGANSLAAIEKQVKEAGGLKNIPQGACVPKIPPGLAHWQGEEAAGICAQANAVCPVTYEKGLVGGDWKPVKHEECLPGGPLEQKRALLCSAMGDCGQKVNFVGSPGRGKGYTTTIQDLDNNNGNRGGIL
jgi:hypothetical protein